MTLVEPRWDEARAALASAVRPLPPVRHLLTACDGLVLAEDLVALCALPSFDTSAMDGWAVAGTGPWAVVGQSLAGRPVPGPLTPGQAVVIATGGVVPAGADAVVRSEDGQVHVRGGAELLSAPKPDGPTHVRPAGEECAAGEVLARAGTVLTPALVGLAAACGHDDLVVVPRPRVALVLFGDELATAGIPPRGLVRDSLGPQVPAWVSRMGCDVVLVERAEDTLAAHVDAIGRAAAAADVVLTTGGTAAGPVDHLHEAIARCDGEVVVDSVAVRPGHPMLAATVERGRTWLVGLPGNPQSAIVTLMSLGAPILAALAGRPALPDLAVMTSAEAVGAPAHEDRLVLGRLVDGAFVPGTHLGSGMLRGLASATGFAVLPPGGVDAGDTVRWLPLPT
ncbi:MAG: molybdopterin molybdotransferase MoeA [Candidatus Nanopelagicales bacterium]|jgi:molybdopterin molybdotransferase|nr:molybdopterin molybdotransferase MoeA [Candidatus Nanopelagicales bacterium]